MLKSLQPKILSRGVLTVCLLAGAVAVVPSRVQARAAVVPSSMSLQARAVEVALQPAVATHSYTSAAHPRVVRARTSRTHHGRSPITVVPPFSVNRAARRLRLGWSPAAAPRHLFGLGLSSPGRDTTFTADGAAPRAMQAASASPATVDLSQYAPPVGNQGQVNSCASWATGYTLLGWYANRYGISGAPYAPMYVYSQLVQGQNIGTTFEGNFGIEQQSIDTQSDYTQGNYDYTDQPTAAERANASHYHIGGYAQIYAQGSGSAQQAIEAALAAGQLVAIGIPVYSNFMNANASSPLVDVPPAGARYYGGHAIVGVKYDATGLWIENQWGASWGLNGYAELSWAFLNQYMYYAYTITGLQGPSGPGGTATAPAGATATATSSVPSATPASGASLSVAPSSGTPGSHFTLTGAGLGSGVVALYSNGAEFALESTTSGGFSLGVSVSSTAAPGPRAIVAINQSSGRQASTTFTVLGAGATATSSPTSAPHTPTPISTTPPSATATRPAATQPPATATPSGGASVTLNPSTAAVGTVVTVSGAGFHSSELVTISLDGTPMVLQYATAQGAISFPFSVPASRAAGPHTVTATGASGVAASATLTVVSSASATSTPVPATATHPAATATTAPTQPAATATSVPTQPAATATAPAGIPTSGSTSNGCQITSDSGQAEAQLLGLLNQHRAAAGVAPLTLNASLSAISRTHSCDMFLHQQLNHNGSDGSTPFQRMAAGGFGIPPYSQEGENIGDAYGTAPSAAVSLIDSQMMAEPLTPGDHHWNIVNSAYSIVGLGVIVANGQTWLTEDFAG